MPMTGILKVGPVIPVIAIDDADNAVPLAHALITGGINVLEITLRTPAAFDAVRQISAQVPDAVVGVGTITLPRQFEEAKAAGARFCVCPGLTPDLAKAAHSCGLPVLPGVMTPTEVIAAHGEGYRQLKLFPAEQAGGVAMLEALAGPFADVIFCPTGGATGRGSPPSRAKRLHFVPAVEGTLMRHAMRLSFRAVKRCRYQSRNRSHGKSILHWKPSKGCKKLGQYTSLIGRKLRCGSSRRRRCEPFTYYIVN